MIMRNSKYCTAIKILITLSLLIYNSLGLIGGSLSVSDMTINSKSTLTFKLTLSTDVSSGGYFLFTFSSGFDLSSTTLTCTSIFGLSTSTPTCTKSSTTVLKVTNVFANTDKYVVFQVSNVQLPSYVSTFTVKAETYTSSGTLVESSSDSTFKFDTEPGDLTLSLVSASSVIAAAYTNLQVSLTLSNSLSTTGYVYMKFPKWNPGTQTRSNAKTMISYTTADYSSSDAGYTIDCTSTSHPNLKCILTVNTPSTVSAIITTYDYLKVSGFSSAIASGGTLTFTLSNSRFRNPPSTKPITTITAETYNSDGTQIDSQQTSFEYQATDGATLSSSSITIIPEATTINEQTQYDFTITTPLPLSVGTTVYVTIPSQISILDTDGESYLLNSAVGVSPLYTAIELTISDSTNQIIKLSNLIPSSSYYVDESTTVQFSLLSLQNPSSTGETDAFEIVFYDSDYEMMTLDTSTGYSLTAVAGEFTDFSITPDNYKTRASVSYTFSFITSNDIPSSGGISIYVPEEITVTSSSLTFKSVTSVSSSATLSYTSSTRIIKLSNAFTSGLTAPASVEFTISAGLQNPASTEESEAFIVSTLDSSGNAIDTDSSVTITASANEISSVTATACTDSIYSSKTSSECSYQLRIYPGSSYPILANSYIEVDIPDEIGIDSSDDTIDYSYTEGLEDSKVTVTYDDYTTFTFKNAFTPTDSSTTEYALDMFSVYITNLTTPRSTEPTSTFKVRIYTSDGYLQYKKESLIYSTVAESQYFQKVVIKRPSEINGESNVIYTFTLNLTSDVYKGEYIKITPPSAVTFYSSKDQCRGVYNLAYYLSCSVSDGSLYIKINPNDTDATTIYAGDILRFQVSNVENPLSFEPTDSFEIYISSSRVYDYYVNQLTYGLSIMNSFPNKLNNVQILPESNKLGATTNYSFYMTTTNIMPIDSYIEVEFPTGLYGPFYYNLTCTAIKNVWKNLKCVPSTDNRQIIKVISGFNSSTLTGGQVIAFKMQGVKNPSYSVTTNSTNQFQIRTMTWDGSESYEIDSSYDLEFTIGCESPCSTCTSEVSKCTSCTSTLNNILYLYGYTCGKSCPTGYYDDSQLVCQKCTYPCLNCMDTATQCTSCQGSSGSPYVNFEDYKCYSSCPSGTYSSDSSLSCESCNSPCKECDTSPDQCISCDDSYYYWEQQCFSSCPNTSVPITSNSIKECQACKKPCQTCSLNRENCTSCQLSPTTYYLYGDSCVEQCPSPYLPNSENVCTKESETVYPFLSLLFSGSVIIIVLVSNKIYPRTRLFTTFLSLQSVVMCMIWVYLLACLAKDKHTSSLGLVIIAVIVNFILNIFWYRYYKKKILPLDSGYDLYRNTYPKIQRFILITSIITTFQLFRLQYSRMFGFQALSCKLQLKPKYYQKLNRYSLIQMTLVYLPIIASNIYNLNWTWYGRQVFWVDIECIISTVLVLVAHIVIILRSENKYVTDKYEQAKNTTTATMMTQVLGQQDDHTPRDPIDELNDKEKRQLALDHIIRKVKKNKDAVETLGITGQGTGEDEEELEDSVRQLDNLVFQGSDTRNIHNKMYQSVGFGNPQSLQKSKAQNQKSLKKLNLNSKNVQQDTDASQTEDYQRLQQESSREDISTTQIINELDFTSAPINADRILKENTIAQQKLENFQKELDQLQKQGKLGKKGANNGQQLQQQQSPLKAAKNLNNNGAYHTLGGVGQYPNDESKNLDEDHSDINQNMVDNMTNNIFKNIVGGQSSNGGDSLFQSRSKHHPHKNNNDRDFDIIFEGDAPVGPDNDEYLNQLEAKRISKTLDHKAFNNLKQDLERQTAQKEAQELEYQQMKQEIKQLEGQINYESTRKEELQIVVEDLSRQIRDLITEFENAKKRKEDELNFLKGANFTSDEEDMGISPSSFNILNQRFSDQEDLKIYLNMIGKGEQQQQMENEPSVAHSNTDQSQSGSNRRRNSKVVPLDDNDLLNFNSQNQKSGPNFHPSQNDNVQYNDGGLDFQSELSVTMTKEEFMKMLEEECLQFIGKIDQLKDTSSKEDLEFSELAKKFLEELKNMGSGASWGGKGDIRIMDVIRELDKRGRKKIEEKYKKVFQDGLEAQAKIKKKRKRLQKKESSDPNKYGAYFNYLPFEKAVIESKGKTPFNNREVEQIVFNPSLTKKNSMIPQAVLDNISNNK